MTNPGLYSGIYQQIREYAEMLDNVLIQLKDDQNSDKTSQHELSEWLSELADERTNALSTRMVALLMIGDDSISRTRWSRLAAVLKTEKVDASVVRELENLAQLLERVQADAMAKMRGWSH